VEWKPRFFEGATTPLGKPELTEEGRSVLKGLHEGKYELTESEITGA
jgi:oxysterol-binding protein-related protein 9/10/11